MNEIDGYPLYIIGLIIVAITVLGILKKKLIVMGNDYAAFEFILTSSEVM